VFGNAVGTDSMCGSPTRQSAVLVQLWDSTMKSVSSNTRWVWYFKIVVAPNVIYQFIIVKSAGNRYGYGYFAALRVQIMKLLTTQIRVFFLTVSIETGTIVHYLLSSLEEVLFQNKPKKIVDNRLELIFASKHKQKHKNLQPSNFSTSKVISF